MQEYDDKNLLQYCIKKHFPQYLIHRDTIIYYSQISPPTPRLSPSYSSLSWVGIPNLSLLPPIRLLFFARLFSYSILFMFGILSFCWSATLFTCCPPVILRQTHGTTYSNLFLLKKWWPLNISLLPNPYIYVISVHRHLYIFSNFL